MNQTRLGARPAVECWSVMQPSNPQPLEYRSNAGSIATSPQGWVLCLLLFIHAAGIGAGRMLWGLVSVGKDPQRKFFWANFIGLALLAFLCVAFKKRLGRLRLLDALIALALGFASSATGMGWALLDGYR